jgi:hypothetical protein
MGTFALFMFVCVFWVHARHPRIEFSSTLLGEAKFSFSPHTFFILHEINKLSCRLKCRSSFFLSQPRRAKLFFYASRYQLGRRETFLFSSARTKFLFSPRSLWPEKFIHGLHLAVLGNFIIHLASRKSVFHYLALFVSS